MPIRYKKRVPKAILNVDREVLIRGQSLEGYNPATRPTASRPCSPSRPG